MRRNKIKIIVAIVVALTLALSVAMLTACDLGGGGGGTNQVAVESVTVSGANTALVGENVTFTATVLPADAPQAVTWSVSAGATISNAGVFNATTATTFTVTASVGGVSGTATIVTTYPTATGVTAANASGLAGSAITLTATVQPVGASATGLTFELVENTIGATLSGNQLTSTQPGAVTFRARLGSLESNVATATFTLDPAQGAMIMNANDLDGIRNNLSGTFQLGADIDLSSFANWTPIGTGTTNATMFTGTFNGNGRTISGLTIDSLLTTGVGLFGVVGTTANIRNFNMADVSVAASNSGAVAGISTGATITNIEIVSGTIGRANANTVGGVVGRHTGGDISGNTNRASVVGAERVGGIVGELNFGTTVATRRLENSNNHGTVNGTTYVGGIVGRLSAPNTVVGQTSATGGSVVTMNTNAGAVTGSASNVGGIIGFAVAGQAGNAITLSSNQNSADIQGFNHVGGILGQGTTNIPTMLESVNTGDITGNNWVGGYAGYAANTAFTGLINSSTIAGNAGVGGIAGRGGVFTNCVNEGDVSASGIIMVSADTYAFLGGIAGRAQSVVGSRNEVDIVYVAAGRGVGGIAGVVDFAGTGGAANRRIENTRNYGDISGADGVGGIAGRIIGVPSPVGQTSPTGGSLVTANINSGLVVGTGNGVGGIVGFTQAGHAGNAITYSSNQNNANIQGFNNVGGIIGQGGTNIVSVVDSTSTGNVTGNNWVGGFAGYTVGTAFTGLTNSNTITGVAGVGGIAGRGGIFTNCVNDGQVIATGIIMVNTDAYAYFGGIAGRATGLINVRNEANIVYTANGRGVGGLAGVVDFAGTGGATARRIENSRNYGNVSGADSVGGIIGRLIAAPSPVGQTSPTGGSAVTANINSGTITGTGSSVGGIVGHAQAGHAGNAITFSMNTAGHANIVGTTGTNVNVVS